MLLALPFPNFNPVLIQLGPFAIRWYALAYIVGILLGWLYARAIIRNQKLWGGPAPMTVTDEQAAGSIRDLAAVAADVQAQAAVVVGSHRPDGEGGDAGFGQRALQTQMWRLRPADQARSASPDPELGNGRGGGVS